MVIVSPTKELSYYMDGKLQRNLDKIKKRVLKKDMDSVFIIDGGEGAGKSVLGMQVAKYLNPKFNLQHICFTANEFMRAITTAKKGECIIFDEAYSGLASRTALSEVNHLLVSMMMEMRQKNLFVIICLPSFFLLDKYVALWRAIAVFHVYIRKGKRGRWICFNRRKKKILYLKGKKDYNYNVIKSRFRGRFLEKYTVDEEVYRTRKSEALKKRERRTKSEKYIEQRNKLLYGIYKDFGLSLSKLAIFCKLYGVSLSKPQIGRLIAKFKGT